MQQLEDLGTRAVRPLVVLDSVLAAGTHWAVSSYAADPTNEHTDVLTRYENLRTGAQVDDPLSPGDRQTVSLNRPGLIAPLCSPVRVPPMVQGGTGDTTAGSVQMLDSVALSVGSYSISTPSLGAPVIRLIRCGSGRSITIDRDDFPFAANRRVVVFATAHSKLRGYLLPSERQFTLTLPAAFRYGVTPQLTDRYIYLEANTLQPSVWRLPISRAETLARRWHASS